MYIKKFGKSLTTNCSKFQVENIGRYLTLEPEADTIIIDGWTLFTHVHQKHLMTILKLTLLTLSMIYPITHP